MEEVINQTIVKIKEILNLDLRKNKEFYTGMTLHFYPALDLSLIHISFISNNSIQVFFILLVSYLAVEMKKRNNL